LKELGLNIDLDDVDQLFRPLDHVIQNLSDMRQVKDLVMRSLTNYAAWSNVDNGPTFTQKMDELRAIKGRLRILKPDIKGNLMDLRLAIAQCTWISTTLKSKILSRFKHTNNHIHNLIYSSGITDISHLFLKDPASVLDAILETITEEIIAIDNSGHQNVVTQKITRRGPRLRKAKYILETDIRKIFRDFKIDAQCCADFIEELMVVLGHKKLN
jgi:hypothetical protein